MVTTRCFSVSHAPTPATKSLFALARAVRGRVLGDEFHLKSESPNAAAAAAAAASASAPTPHGLQLPPPVHPREVEALDADEASRHIVCFVGEALVGYARWRWAGVREIGASPSPSPASSSSSSSSPPAPASPAEPCVALVDRIAVLSHYRRKGIGQRLLDAVRRDTSEQPGPMPALPCAGVAVLLPPAPAFAPAAALLQKIGYRPLPARPDQPSLNGSVTVMAVRGADATGLFAASHEAAAAAAAPVPLVPFVFPLAMAAPPVHAAAAAAAGAPPAYAVGPR
jgi:GNAT superfamily N-acetyltransferase